MRRIADPKAIYVLTVTIAGRVFRFAEQDVEIEGVPYRGGLAVEGLSESLSFLVPDTPNDDATVSGLVFPVDLAAMEVGGAWMESGTAELSRWSPETLLSERSVVVRGRIANPAYGLEGEPASLAITPDGIDELTLFPPTSAKVDADTYPDAPSGSRGLRYPFPIGKPGLPTDYPDGRRGAVPGIALDIAAAETTVLISGAPVAATAVRMFRDDDLALPGENCPVTLARDGRGRTVAVATWPHGSASTGGPGPGPGPPGAGENVVVDGAIFRVDWSTSLGGILGNDGQPLGPMGRVTEYMLSQSSVDWDAGAWASARDVLDSYRVDGYLDEPAPPWETALAAWLWLAPVSVRAGENGLLPIAWRIEPAPPALMAFVVDENCERVDEFETDGAERANAFSFAHSADREDEYAVTDTLDSATSHPCATSESHHGRIDSAESMESRMVYDTPTAFKAMSWRSIAYAHPRWVRRIMSSRPEARERLVGDYVTLTDSLGGADSLGAYVVDIVRSLEIVTLTLAIIHRP